MSSFGHQGGRVVWWVLTALLWLPAASNARADSDSRAAYERARSAYFALKGSTKRQQLRHHWSAVIEAFTRVARRHPRSPEAVRAQYTSAELYSDLHRISGRASDLDAALAAYRAVTTAHGSTNLADDALFERARLLLERRRDRDAAAREVRELLARYGDGDMAPQARALLAKLGSAPASGSARRSAAAATPPAVQRAAPAPAPRPVVKARPRIETEPAVELRGKHVVIDPGHGGTDSGARGPGGLLEKDVALAIAKRAAGSLRAAGLRVTLTREDDTYLGLEERTQLANDLGADAFVSLHANSHRNASVRGIETYFLDVTSDRYAKRLANLENRTSGRAAGDLQLILADLTTKSNTRESEALAQRVQGSLTRAAKPVNPKTRDLGVKGALFYVLLGARMPAVLVETSFLSHPKEAKLLATADYQARLASAVADAVVAHLQQPLATPDP